jgi:hypothetical protein
MATYLIKRLLQGIIVLLAVSFVCFIMFRYTGDPVLMLAGKYATQQEREMVRVSYGWTAPFTQYASFHRWRPQGRFRQILHQFGGCPGHDPGTDAGNTGTGFYRHLHRVHPGGGIGGGGLGVAHRVD